MAKLTQFSEAANLAIHSLAYLGSCEPGELRSAAEIARHMAVSEAHLGKVLQRLAKFGLVRSVRGAKGGFALSPAPETVTVLEIVELIDGPLEVDTCMLGKPICRRGRCVFKGMLDEIHQLVHDRLSETRLSDFSMAERSGARRPGARRVRQAARRRGSGRSATR